jgi:uncharacterized protein HemX
MFGSIKIALILIMLAGAGGGYMYVQKLQSDLETARENVAKLEVAVQTSEASLKLERENMQKMSELNNRLQSDLQKAEQYGDELRATLQRHNLTHLATQKPGLIEPRMQNATDKLWKDLTDITTPVPSDGVQQSAETGREDSNSN